MIRALFQLKKKKKEKKRKCQMPWSWGPQVPPDTLLLSSGFSVDFNAWMTLGPLAFGCQVLAQ